MEIAQLRQILAVRRHGSFAKAAMALGMAQPSLSKSIARLEDQLKVRLFDRTASGSTLTPFGQQIVETASRVIAETEGVMRDAALIAGGVAGRVRLGVTTSLADAFLPRLLPAIVAAYPQLGLHVEIGTDLVTRLLARRLDLAFMVPEPDARDAALAVSSLFETRAVAVASPDHPLAGLAHVDRQTFARHRVVSPGGGFRADAVLGMPEAPALSFYTTNAPAAFLPLVLAGAASLVAPLFMVQPLIRSGALVRLNIDFGFPVTYAAVTTRAASHSPILKALVRTATDLGSSLTSEWDLAGG